MHLADRYIDLFCLSYDQLEPGHTYVRLAFARGLTGFPPR